MVGADIRLLEVEDEAADQDRVQPDKEVDISLGAVGGGKGNKKAGDVRLDDEDDVTDLAW